VIRNLATVGCECGIDDDDDDDDDPEEELDPRPILDRL
jgi:hypothetical protein